MYVPTIFDFDPNNTLSLSHSISLGSLLSEKTARGPPMRPGEVPPARKPREAPVPGRRLPARGVRNYVQPFGYFLFTFILNPGSYSHDE